MSDSAITHEVDSAVRILLYDKFSDIMGFELSNVYNDIIQWPSEAALRERAEKCGQDYLEFMSFWRSSTSPSWSRQRTSLARRGMWLQSGDLSSVNIKAQPVDLSYNVWVWSKSLDKVYQCIEKYILWQNTYPKADLEYTVGSGSSYEYTPDLHFGEVIDESTFGSKYQKGIIVSYKFPIKVDAWVLSGATESNIITKIRLTVYDKDSLTEYSEIVTDDSNQDTELADRLRLSRRRMYGISEVNLVTNSVTTPQDRVDEFSVDDMVVIEGSTGNDDVYSVLSASLLGGSTVLILGNSHLTDGTADGIISKSGS